MGRQLCQYVACLMHKDTDFLGFVLPFQGCLSKQCWQIEEQIDVCSLFSIMKIIAYSRTKRRQIDVLLIIKYSGSSNFCFLS